MTRTAIKVAPYEIASSLEARPDGKFLYYHNKKYLRPTLTPEQILAIRDKILSDLSPNKTTLIVIALLPILAIASALVFLLAGIVGGLAI